MKADVSKGLLGLAVNAFAVLMWIGAAVSPLRAEDDGHVFQSRIFTTLVQNTTAKTLTKKELIRISDEGPVEVSVLYLNPMTEQAGNEISFEVRMNTHSVDLDAYAMARMSFLRIDGGPEREPLGWFEPGGGGHHRFGILKFTGPLPADGQSLKLVIRGVGGVKERVFEWKLSAQSG